MVLSILLRKGVRELRRRKLGTASVIILIVAGTLGITLVNQSLHALSEGVKETRKLVREDISALYKDKNWEVSSRYEVRRVAFTVVEPSSGKRLPAMFVSYSGNETLRPVRVLRGKEPSKGEVVVDALAKKGLDVGDEVKVGDVTFRVCGVGMSQGYNAPLVFYADEEDVERLPNRYYLLLIKTDNLNETLNELRGANRVVINQATYMDVIGSMGDLVSFFSWVSLALSSVMILGLGLVESARLIREVGALKALGASTFQISLLLASPNLMRSLTGVLVGGLLGIFFSSLLYNALKEPFGIVTPFRPNLMELVMLLALFFLITATSSIVPPILVSRRTAAQCLRDYGLSGRPFNLSLDGFKLTLALRNSLRKGRKQVVLTGALIAVMVAFSVNSSLTTSLKTTLEYSAPRYKAAFFLPYYVDESLADELGAELWEYEVIKFRNLTTAFMRAPPESKALPKLKEGNWSDLVIGLGLSVKTGLKVGDRLSLRVGNQLISGRVSGISYDVTENGNSIIKLGRGRGNLLIFNELRPSLEEKLLSKGLPGRYVTRDEVLEATRSNMAMISSIFWIVSLSFLVTALVGLASISFTDLSERRREMGVMMAIGAEKRFLTFLNVVESLILSIPLALILGYPLTYLVSMALVRMFSVEMFPMEFAFNCIQPFISILLSVLLTTLVITVAIRGLGRLSELLRYE